ncbi:MAG: sugar ABC transporter permease [Ruminococcaceae bacterium]|nr:sugar ABC transporter permease [Oscillospiraceae bacterium]
MSENITEKSLDEISVTPAEIAPSELDSNGLLKKRARKVSLDSRKARAGYAFVMPFILGVLFIYLPILLDSVWFSMSELNFKTDEYNFIGPVYYVEAFTKNTKFVTNLMAGLQQLVFEVPAVIIFSLFIAVVLNQKMLGRAAFRAIFFLPVIVSTGIMETINAGDIMSNQTQGGIDDGSGQSGASQIVSTLDVERLFASMKVGGELVTYVVNIVNNVYNIINYSGVQMLIFLAGLQSISPSIYEACRIDGATGWETFWKVTFPMISPMILVNAVYTIIDAFTRTQNPMIKYINQVYGANPYSATAMSWIYFGIIILIIAAFAGIASTFIFYQRRD